MMKLAAVVRKMRTKTGSGGRVDTVCVLVSNLPKHDADPL